MQITCFSIHAQQDENNVLTVTIDTPAGKGSIEFDPNWDLNSVRITELLQPTFINKGRVDNPSKKYEDLAAITEHVTVMIAVLRQMLYTLSTRTFIWSDMTKMCEISAKTTEEEWILTYRKTGMPEKMIIKEPRKLTSIVIRRACDLLIVINN